MNFLTQSFLALTFLFTASLPSNAEESVKEDLQVKEPARAPSSTNPKHYTRWKIEPLVFCMQNDLPFWLGNVLKYCMRYDAKDGLQDLYKARVYLNKKIEELEKS